MAIQSINNESKSINNCDDSENKAESRALLTQAPPRQPFPPATCVTQAQKPQKQIIRNLTRYPRCLVQSEN